MAKEVWRNRIVGYGEVDVSADILHERNWRRHPEAQAGAFDGLAGDVGIVQNILVNKRTGPEWPEDKRGMEKLIDGELRILRARAKGQKTLPVTYVDLSPAEEAEVLATLDPIGAMAETDARELDALQADFQTENADLQAMLDELSGGDRQEREDRPLEEIDADTLPVRPIWVLCTVPVEAMPDVAPLLDQLALFTGVTVEMSDGAGA